MGFDTGVELKASLVKTQFSTDQGIPLGTRGFTNDGRVFRWTLNAATALTLGVPVQSAALEVLDKDTEYTAGVNDTEDISTTWRQIKLDTEAATKSIAADEYADGWLRIANSTVYAAGEGQLIRIKSHDASATSSTDAAGSTMTVVFADDDVVLSGIDTGAIITVHHSPYWQVIACAGGASPTGYVVGVPVRPVSASYYFWAQTWGPCAVLQDGATARTAEELVVSTSTADSLSPVGVRTSTNSTFIGGGDTDADAGIGLINAVAAVRQKIGFTMGSPGTDAYFEMVFLTISP